MIEASACEKPVIVSRIGGLVEVVDENKTGLIVPPASPSAIAEAISKLLDNEDLRKNLGLYGRIWVQNHFDCQENVSIMFQEYSKANLLL